MNKIEISPSIISSDLLNLGEQIRKCERSGADSFHLDVMDGNFVDNITMGPDMVKAIRRATKMRLDAHLMINRPDKYYGKFIEAGSDVLLIHYESPVDIGTLIKNFEKENIRYGITINPNTGFDKISRYMDNAEILLVMSVYPGFSGQKFIESSLDTIKKARTYIDKNNLKTRIEIDGGINNITGKMAIDNGADILVSASYIFYNNIEESIKTLKNL